MEDIKRNIGTPQFNRRVRFLIAEMEKNPDLTLPLSVGDDTPSDKLDDIETIDPPSNETSKPTTTKQSWHEQKLCLGVEWMLTTPRRFEVAKAMCRRCPVRKECLLEDIRYDQPAPGIIAGFDQSQRYALVAERSRRIVEAEKAAATQVTAPQNLDS